MPRSLVAALPALLLAIVALAPFHDKPFTIDDPLFMIQAGQALRDPIHPTAVDVVWSYHTMRLSAIMPSGPVMAWLLMPAAWQGSTEWVAHAVVWVMLCLGLLATVALGIRLGFSRSEATLAGVFLVTSPAVLGMASTVMPDVAAMSLGVAGVERLLAWSVERRWHQAVLAAMLLALAVLTRSQLVVVVAAAAVMLHEGREFSSTGSWLRLIRRVAAPLGGAVVLVLGIMVMTRDSSPGGGGVLASTLRFVSWRSMDRNLLAYGAHWLLVFPLGIAFLLVRGGRLPWRASWLLLPLCIGLQLLSEEPTRAWVIPVALIGMLVVLDLVREGWRSGDPGRLALAVWLLAPMPLLTYMQLPSKYLVASAPAASLLAARALLAGGQRWKRVAAAGLALAGLIVGELVILADARLAGAAKNAAETLIRPRTQRGERVWYAGHWGLHWYAEREGARPLSFESLPAPGDIIVYSSVAAHSSVISQVKKRTLLETHLDGERRGRVMSYRQGAGFYSNHAGYLPWVYGTGDDERFEVWRVDG